MSKLVYPIVLLLLATVESANVPGCVGICKISSALFLGGSSSLEAQCSLEYRTQLSICEVASCSDSVYQSAKSSDEQLCAPVYQQNATLASSVSSSLASAIPIAKAATEGKDPTVQANFPICAQTCQNNSAIFQICGSLSNATCICNAKEPLTELANCERLTCNPEDTTREAALANALCSPVGGVLANINGTGSLSEPYGPNSTNTTTSSTPTPSPFTGSGAVNAVLGISSIIPWICLVLGVFLL